MSRAAGPLVFITGASSGIGQALAARFPNVPEYAAAAARGRTSLGAVYIGLAQPADARWALDRAHTALTRLATDYPAVAEYRRSSARTAGLLSNSTSVIFL